MKTCVIDKVILDLSYAKTLLGQVQDNHSLPITPGGKLSPKGEYDYCRTFPYNAAILDIVQEKLADAFRALDTTDGERAL